MPLDRIHSLIYVFDQAMQTRTEAALAILGIYFPLTRFFRSEFRAGSELTLDQFRTLMLIRHGKNQVGKLAEENSISQPTMSKMIDTLVGAGFVERTPHPSDRRQIELRLTPSGDAAVKKIGGSIAGALARRLDVLDEGEVAAIRAVAKRLGDLLADR